MHGHQHGPGCRHDDAPAVGAASAGAGPAARDPLDDLLEMRDITDVDVFRAVELGWLPRVRALVEADAAVLAATRTVEKGTPLHFACLHGQIAIVEYFMRCVVACATIKLSIGC